MRVIVNNAVYDAVLSGSLEPFRGTLASMEYTLQKSLRAKHMRITVRRDQTVTVTIPHGLNVQQAELFVAKKEKWIKNALIKLSTQPRTDVAIPRPNRKDYLYHKASALLLVEERLQQFNMFYGLKWNTITIKNMKSRWGSCSKQGNLNFSYRITLLPRELADYLVVHELCHLGEFNHSPDFWKLVEKTIPNYKLCRKQLKTL